LDGFYQYRYDDANDPVAEGGREGEGGRNIQVRGLSSFDDELDNLDKQHKTMVLWE